MSDKVWVVTAALFDGGRSLLGLFAREPTRGEMIGLATGARRSLDGGGFTRKFGSKDKGMVWVRYVDDRRVWVCATIWKLRP